MHWVSPEQLSEIVLCQAKVLPGETNLEVCIVQCNHISIWRIVLLFVEMRKYFGLYRTPILDHSGFSTEYSSRGRHVLVVARVPLYTALFLPSCRPCITKEAALVHYSEALFCAYGWIILKYQVYEVSR